MAFERGAHVGNFTGFKDFSRPTPGNSNTINGKRPNNLKKFSSNPISPVVQAVNQDMQFNKIQKPGLDVAQTILGLMPSGPLPMGIAFGAGRFINKQVDEDALNNPEKYTTIPGMPGGVKTKSGPLQSNRALPSPAQRNVEAPADESVKKKKQALPTLLGAVASPLGTFSNPVQIT